MPKKNNQSKPDPVKEGPVSATVVEKRGKKAGGVWYWRFTAREDGERWTPAKAAWGTRAEIMIRVAELVSTKKYREPREKKEKPPEAPVVLWQLVDAWIRMIREHPELEQQSKKALISAAESLIYIKNPPRNRKKWRARAQGSVVLERLNRSHLEAFIDARRRQASPLTIRNEVRAFRRIIEWGSDRGWCRPPRELGLRDILKASDRARPVRPKYTPSQGDAVAVLRHLEGWPRMAVLLQMATGCRTGELASLTRERVIELPHGEGFELRLIGKNRKKHEKGYRRVYLLQRAMPRTVQALREWLARPRNPTLTEKMLEQLSDGRTRTSTELAEALKIPGKMARDYLIRQERAKTIAKVGKRIFPTKRRSMNLYRITEAGRLALLPPGEEPLLGVTPKTAGSHLPVELSKACNAAGLPHWTPTGHRRSMSVRMFEARVNPLAYEGHMDHSEREGRKSYAEITAAHQRQAASILSDLPSGELIELKSSS